MTPRPALVFLAFTVLLVIGAAVVQVRSALAYLANGHAVSSTSGDHVYRYGGGLLGYPTFAVGPEPVYVALALLLLVVGVLVAALSWRPGR